jgi:hypothetical protein
MVIALKEREGNKNKSTGAMNIWVPVRKKKKKKKTEEETGIQTKHRKTHYVCIIEKKGVIIIHGDMLKVGQRKNRNRHRHHIDEANSADN